MRRTATLEGYILPYVRMTQAGKWVKAKAKEYLVNQNYLAWQLKLQLDPLPKKTPIAVSLIFWRKWLYVGDLDNLEKAVLDALQLAGILPNDAWVVRVVKEKFRAEEGPDRTEINLAIAKGGKGAWGIVMDDVLEAIG